MSKVTQSANGQDCSVRIPGVCNHMPETTVFAHINGIRFGHGVGKKTKLGAYACSSCHDVIDGRVQKKNLDKTSIKLAHYEGVFETLMKLESDGLVKLG